MQRDSIDFGSMKVGQLFCKQLFPTLLGMVFSALFVITDGVFVGRGIGSDALAAVNIAAPLFVFAAGMGLMFGMAGQSWHRSTWPGEKNVWLTSMPRKQRLFLLSA